jgi:hypothetical protein
MALTGIAPVLHRYRTGIAPKSNPSQTLVGLKFMRAHADTYFWV